MPEPDKIEFIVSDSEEKFFIDNYFDKVLDDFVNSTSQGRFKSFEEYYAFSVQDLEFGEATLKHIMYVTRDFSFPDIVLKFQHYINNAYSDYMKKNILKKNQIKEQNNDFRRKC